ncbi:MAG: DUF5011 domain-containing protein, partial [Alteromonadales bacterium]|nr:DUF5011 domain-containing protein [Alteromonadales bacterium]
YGPGTYTIILKAVNTAGETETYTFELIILDTEIPLISLIGDASITITVGDTYTDLGATAIDNVDGDITANIVVGGDTVDTSTAGTYEITYNVTDTEGNEADEVIRTVIVEEAALTCTETLLELPIDFDCDGLDYASKATNSTAEFSVVDNPYKTGVNTADSKVGQFINDNSDDWENIFFDLDSDIDLTTDKTITLKLYSTIAAPIKLKLEGNGATEADTNHTGSGWEELTFVFTSGGQYPDMVLFVDGPGSTAGTFYIDDIEQVTSGGGSGSFDDGLLTNGDFESGSDSWIGNAVNVQTIGDNSFNSADVTTAGNPYDVNLSQVVELVQDNTYTLSFDASSDNSRTIVVGIGLNFDPWTNVTETANLTSSTQTFSYEFTATGFGDANSRVIFDLGAETGSVIIDNVSLFLKDTSGGGGTCPDPPTGDLISNGDFEAGDVGCWELINNGGSATISSSVSSGSGSKSGQIQTAPLKNPGIKQQRFAAGTALPNTLYEVTFDIKADASTPLVDGAVFQAFTFSEGVDGGSTDATQHVLVQGLGSVSTSWETKTYTFTSGAAAANVEGGFSFLAELVCGGASTCDGIINIDNVSIKKK